MNAYVPGNAMVLILSAVLCALLVGLGYGLNRWGTARRARGIAWLVTIAGFLAMLMITDPAPAGFRMLALVAALLYGMKGVVAVESRLRGGPALDPIRWLCFCVGWFGMRPELFAKLFTGPPLPGARKLIISGLISMVGGMTCMAAARWVTSMPLLALALLMVGLSLTVHFGLFDLLAGVYRHFGVDCAKFFRAPYLSRSLTEFWSRRWNIAFSEMAAIAIFRPAKSRVGAETARTMAFLFSGLVHELAISLPVRAGYGLPLAYFLLHAAAMRLEGTEPVRQALKSRPLAHAWTIAWVLLPVPLLFHAPFRHGVLWPLLN